tara:strand:- start:779 stop:1009 length:231 start_codon:yes stop_codon:yes gene_type:complete
MYTRKVDFIEHKTDKCSICKELLDVMISYESKEILWDQGHNAEPFNDGRCCTSCNHSVVTPLRLELAVIERNKDNG